MTMRESSALRYRLLAAELRATKNSRWPRLDAGRFTSLRLTHERVDRALEVFSGWLLDDEAVDIVARYPSGPARHVLEELVAAFMGPDAGGPCD
jgi:hypothetical protein